jgi:hypothetical protein
MRTLKDAANIAAIDLRVKFEQTVFIGSSLLRYVIVEARWERRERLEWQVGCYTVIVEPVSESD